MPDLIVSGLLDSFLLDVFVRGVLLFLGVAASLHYFLMAKAMEEGPHIVRLGVAVTAGLGVVCIACAITGKTWHGAVAGTMTGAVSVGVQLLVWGQGIYVRDQLNRAHAMALAAKAAGQYRYNLVRRDLAVPYEAVADLVTPSGFDELPGTQGKKTERA